MGIGCGEGGGKGYLQTTYLAEGFHAQFSKGALCSLELIFHFDLNSDVSEASVLAETPTESPSSTL